MGAAASKSFDSVTIGEAWGVANANGFHQGDTHRNAPSGCAFSVCRIQQRQVAVFMGMTMPEGVRAELALRKPDWLDALVYATVLSDPDTDVAVIEAHVLTPVDAELPMCAFASACVAFDLGLLKVVPGSYLVRFEAGSFVRVRMHFDDDANSWSGDTALHAVAS